MFIDVSTLVFSIDVQKVDSFCQHWAFDRFLPRPACLIYYSLGSE